VTANLCRVGGSCWYRLPYGGTADQALCCGKVERRSRHKMCDVVGGWPRSKQAPVARKRFCNELGAAQVSRGHRCRPLARWSAQLCARRRRSCAPSGARSSPAFREPVTPRERGAVRSEGMVRFAASQTLLRAEPVMQPSGPNIVLLLVLTRFAGLAVGSVRSGWVATSSRTRASVQPRRKASCPGRQVFLLPRRASNREHRAHITLRMT
jgi:hypothetical protein